MIPMFLQYVHDHSSSYTLTAKDLNRITEKGADEITLEAPLVFPVDEPVEVDDAIGQLILEHKGLYDLVQVNEDGELIEPPAKEDEEPKSSVAGTTASPGATTSSSAGAASTAGSTAGSGTASGAGAGTSSGPST